MLTTYVHRTAGDCIYVLCRPAIDHRALLPAIIRDRVTDEVVVKAYRLRALAHVAPLGMPRSGYYHQVCVAAIITGDPSEGEGGVHGKHWNYVMWNDGRDSLSGNLETGHRKRIAEIVEDFALAPEAETHAFGRPEDTVRVRVSRLGVPLLGIDAQLGAVADAGEIPIYTGVAGEREDLHADGRHSTLTPYPVTDLTYWSTRSASVQLRVGSSDGLYDYEALEAVRGADIIGAWMSGVFWTLPPVARQASIMSEVLDAR